MSSTARPTRVTRAQVLKGSALLFLLVGTYALAQWLDVGDLLNPERIVTHLQAAGPFGPLLFMFLMAAAVVISPLPSLPLDLAAGATFGVTLGTIYAVIGAEIGAILSFLIGRALGREALARILRMKITFCEHCSDRHLAVVVFLARLVPIFSFDLVSYGAGLTNMSLQAFAAATLLGMIPPTFAMTSLGGYLAVGKWPTILLGTALVAFLVLLPKVIVRHTSSRWVALFRGGSPVAVPRTAAETTVDVPCSTCGGPLP